MAEVTQREEAPRDEVDLLPEEYVRFRLGARIEHTILMVSFTVLALTGLPQLFPTQQWARSMIFFMGGIQMTRLIHHYAAIILVIGSVFAIFVAAYRYYVRGERMPMFPMRKDWYDMKQTIAYNLGRAEEPPRMLKFNYGEKFEYWAVIWGTALMAISGFIMWNPIAFTSVFPGELIPMAKAAHGGEALLAVTSIVIWHMYNVHVKHFNRSIFTGKMSRKQMEEEHALELERLDAGEPQWPLLEKAVEKRRQRIYLAVTTVLGIILLVVIIWAFTFEETAIITVTPTPGS